MGCFGTLGLFFVLFHATPYTVAKWGCQCPDSKILAKFALTKGFATSVAALATHIRRRYMLDRVLLFEHGFHFGQLAGLEVGKLR